jgi:Ca-activated chloride channel homolog
VENIMKFINTSFTILVLFLFGLSVYAQDEKPIRIETNLVNFSVAVLDRKGKNVENLTKEKFEVYDNGVKQTIANFSSEAAPVSFGIVYDMHPTTDERTTAVLESLREFAKELKGENDLFTLIFNNRGSLMLDFVPTSEQVRKNLVNGFQEPNALYDAIFLATEKLSKSRNLKRVLLVITDSADHRSEHKFGDVVKKLKTLDVQIYTILWDEANQWKFSDVTRSNSQRTVSSDASKLDRAALQDLALRTGGTMNSPAVQNAQELFEIYKEIAFETKKQYSIGFYPTANDGKWHEVKVILRKVADKNIVLSYRLGYQSYKSN